MTGIGKRPPAGLSWANVARAERMSKSDWIDLYHDLYIQSYGEDAPDGAWLQDAERRHQLLKLARQGKR